MGLVIRVRSSAALEDFVECFMTEQASRGFMSHSLDGIVPAVVMLELIY